MARTVESRAVSACYDHLSGRLGEALFRFLVDRGWVTKAATGREYDITAEGWRGLESLGVDLARLSSSKRKVLSPCVERYSGRLYEHPGAYLGALLAARLVELGWLARIGEREYKITRAGQTGLKQMGIVIE